jgi:hypothetical protein
MYKIGKSYKTQKQLWENGLITLKQKISHALSKYVQLTPDTNGKRPILAYFTHLWYSNPDPNDPQDHDLHFMNWYDDPLCFVTGEVMSNWTAQGIPSFANYEQYLHDSE